MVRERGEMDEFASLLSGGNRRSTGKADLVANLVISNPGRFEELWICLGHIDPIVRMRAADALEKATRRDATVLQAHKDEILSERLDDGTSEVRWHLVVLSSRLQLGIQEARKVFARLHHFVETDNSKIVRVMALQAAADLGKRHPALKKDVNEMIRIAKASGFPSLQARARKLLSSP